MPNETYLKRYELYEAVESNVLHGDSKDWEQWLKPADRWRVISADMMAEACKEKMLLGKAREEGLMMPWYSASNRVLIKPGKLCVWTGWSRHGKTQMLKQLMTHAIREGEKVLIASMEEEIEEVWIDMARIYTGGPTPTARALDDFIKFVSGKLWLYDQQGAIEDTRMQAVLRYAGTELKTTQAVVDSLMMLKVNREDYDQQSRFVGELKSIAKDTHQTIHLVAHMRKRDGKGGEDSPGGMHDIAGGHEIGSKADYVFNVWRDIKNEMDSKALLTVEKQRGDVNWLGKIALNFHPGSRQFIEGNSIMRFDQ